MRACRRLALAACLVVAASALPWRAEAQSAAPSEPSDAQIERRLAFIESSLDARRRYAQIWFWTWMSVNTGSVVALSVRTALADNAADRVNFIGNAVLSALGIGDMLLFRPVDARFGSGPIRALPDCKPGAAAAQARGGGGPAAAQCREGRAALRLENPRRQFRRQRAGRRADLGRRRRPVRADHVRRAEPRG